MFDHTTFMFDRTTFMFDHTTFMFDHTTFYIYKSDNGPQLKWVVSLMTADGHVNLPQGFVWVCMSFFSVYYFFIHKGLRLVSNMDVYIDQYGCLH